MRVIYDFIAEGFDELTVAADEELVVVDDV